MFGAFGYLVRADDAARSLRAVRAHLVPRGLFVFEYWQTSGVRPGTQSWIARRADGCELLRLSEARFDPQTSVLAFDFRFLIRRSRTVLDAFSERHRVRTYTRREMIGLLRSAGFEHLAGFAGTPQRKQFERVAHDTFRIMEVARAK